MLDKVYEWYDEKLEEAVNDENARRAGAKAFGLGMLNGALTFMAAFGTVVYTGLIVSAFKRK